MTLQPHDRTSETVPEAEMPDLTVIVVSYNTRELTLAALRTLHAETRDTRFRTVVFDNASEDGSAEAVAAEFPQVEVIASPENLGFAKANNVVAAQVTTEWILLLNPDTEVQNGAVDKLMAFARAHPENGIYGGRTVFPDGSLNIASCWQRITPWSLVCSTFGLTALFPRTELFHPEAMGGWARDSVREVDIVVGCFMLMKRALWEDLGGFDLRYFMYGEEADLCLRAARKGWRPIITPEAQIMHIVGAASRSQGGKKVLLAQARATLIRDHWPAGLVPLGLGLMWLWAALRVVASSVLGPLMGRRDAQQAWKTVWQARRTWLAGYGAPMSEPDPGPVAEEAEKPRKKSLSYPARVLRGVGALLDPRAWAHAVRLVNYYNYSHVVPRRSLKLGRDVRLSPNTAFSNPARIEIGDRVSIGAHCTLWAGPATGRIVIGADALFGPEVFVTASGYRFNDGSPVTQQAMDEADVIIGRDVWLGARVMVMPGARIGDGAIIGAGALVRGEIPPGAIAVGVPAKVVGRRQCPVSSGDP